MVQERVLFTHALQQHTSEYLLFGSDPVEPKALEGGLVMKEGLTVSYPEEEEEEEGTLREEREGWSCIELLPFIVYRNGRLDLRNE